MSVRLIASLSLRKCKAFRNISTVNILYKNKTFLKGKSSLYMHNDITTFNASKDFFRTKYTKKSSHMKDEDSDEEDKNENIFADEQDSKIVKTKLNSLRTDLILKAGLGIARNKVETYFYESKIRVNGKKILKKSAQLNINDEVDIIKGFSQTNPSHLLVSRVKILSVEDREVELFVAMRRYKSLVIENYEGSNAYKSSETPL
ncbi:mitochondrial transcription rescue factor 1 [Condylostylus longicornis]|uniref:mitochondrial transcription rescue factor 1 n=1 Tax=Condylostylus longicornis TaxID=2530218 RepID=UPI00244E4DB3|nr:mitochondrial transcription rescue factor 1 [Condylostylus longicornis]